MFILICNGYIVNVYQAAEVDALAHEFANDQGLPCEVVQHEMYLGDLVEKDYHINTVVPDINWVKPIAKRTIIVDCANYLA